MSKSQLQQNDHSAHVSGTLSPESFEELMTWRIRWYLIIVITIAYVASLIAGFIGYSLTKDPHYLLFITPTALIPFVRYLVPMDKRQYDLKLAKINAGKGLPEAKPKKAKFLPTRATAHRVDGRENPQSAEI